MKIFFFPTRAKAENFELREQLAAIQVGELRVGCGRALRMRMKGCRMRRTR